MEATTETLTYVLSEGTLLYDTLIQNQK